MRYLWIALSGMILVAADCSLASEGAVRVRMGDMNLSVPSDYILTNPFFERMASVLDTSRAEMNLRFTGSEIANSIPGYPPEDNMIVLIMELSDQEAKFQTTDIYRDMLTGVGEYESRVVEQISGTNIFRVYRSADLRTQWDIVASSPSSGDDHVDAKDVRVAVCYTANKGPSCMTNILLGRIHIQYRFDEQYLFYAEKIGVFLKSKLESWEVKVK